jgi:hypothetical protein
MVYSASEALGVGRAFSGIGNEIWGISALSSRRTLGESISARISTATCQYQIHCGPSWACFKKSMMKTSGNGWSQVLGFDQV